MLATNLGTPFKAPKILGTPKGECPQGSEQFPSNFNILFGPGCKRHFHPQRVQVMENKTNFNSSYIFSLFTQSITTNYITNSQNTLVLRLKQIIKGW